jgi:DNA-binding transcriptional LysR family regulator
MGKRSSGLTFPNSAGNWRPGSQLALGASQTISQYLWPNLIAGFLRQNPRVAITVIPDTLATTDCAKQKTQLALTSKSSS